MKVLIYHNDEFLAETTGTREAATLVASHEKVTNIFMVEQAIMNSILTGKKLDKYKFKFKENK